MSRVRLIGRVGDLKREQGYDVRCAVPESPGAECPRCSPVQHWDEDIEDLAPLQSRFTVEDW